MTLKHLMTVKEVAALLRVSTQTLYKMLEQGQIPAVRVGSQWRFDRDKVKGWIESQGAPPSSARGGDPSSNSSS
jgi:excisionase family DNA binding protein